MTPVVAVMNMKGGVGKTTISANIFREIFLRRGKRTLLVDFDPQFNLSQLLLTEAQYDTLKADGDTILAVLEAQAPDSVFATATANSDANQTWDIDGITRRLKYLTGDPQTSLRLLAGDFNLARYNLREDPRTLAGPRRRFKAFIAQAKEEFDLVVLDCNPSSSFLTRTALEAATHLVIPVRPDRFSILGVQMIMDYIGGLSTIHLPPALSIVINDVVGGEVTSVESQLRAHANFGPNVLVNRIPHSKILTARSDYSGFATDRRVPWSTWLRGKLVAVANELAGRLGV